MIGWWLAAGLAGAESDPFEGVAAKPAVSSDIEESSWWHRLWSENFGYRWELMAEFGLSHAGASSSRQSAGFEVLKRFSTETKTVAGVNVQGRLVRRDGFTGAPNDMEGMNRPGWALEYHNAYVDVFNALDPVLNEGQRNAALGRFNVRIGRFYVPFGLNLQSDTHGTILQLSNERNFGFERDWYAGAWGVLTDDLRYEAHYLMGSGYGLRFNDQRGMVAFRIALANKYLSDIGLEGGISHLTGQRYAPDAVMRFPAIAARAGATDRVETSRTGVDARYRMVAPSGVLTWTAEISGGEDAPDAVWTQLYQVDYLDATRRWGLASQVRRFWQDLSRDRALSPGMFTDATDASWIGEATWYFSNDVASSNLEWVKVACEVPLERQMGAKEVVWTLQYYRYW